MANQYEVLGKAPGSDDLKKAFIIKFTFKNKRFKCRLW